MDMFFFFLPYIVLGITLVVAITVPVSVWFVGILLNRVITKHPNDMSTFEDTL